MRLKELRKELGKTQAEIAKLLNLTPVAYNRYEKELREPGINTLIKLSDYYSVSLDYLVGREFNNEFGYLSENEKNIVSAYRAMTPEIQAKTSGIIIRMLAEC